MAINENMKNELTIEKLAKLIDAGTKIYKVDELNGKMQIIEGVAFTNDEPNILISKYRISFTDELKTLIETSKFQDDVLKKFSEKHDSKNKLHLRISCTLGETDFFYDISGNRNCYGIGLNEAARILFSGQNEILTKYSNEDSLDSVFFDKTVLNQASSLIKSLTKNSSYFPTIKDLGYIADKHDKKRQIWWLKDLPLDRTIDLYFNKSGNKSH